MSTFDKYKEAVAIAHTKKRTEGRLPANLRDHTAANLKKECIVAFMDRFNLKDTETFTALFGKSENKEEYFARLRLSDPDIFRPLNNYLKGNTDDTRNQNIELLAWLIDFEPRPFTNFIGQKGKKKKIGVDFLNQKIAILTLTLLFLVSIIYNVFKPRGMYWDGKEYKTYSLYDNVEGIIILPLDTFKLAHQKKITNVTRITRNGIGIIQYSKINKVLTFYTARGNNPDDTSRTLSPMSEYIYEKYVVPKKQKKPAQP
ncbi:hypothetical protein [Pedobacter hartonius]|uniref:Uncharacterized protein n=1 Tax=Pedobacter hartonius TaxID=425514 RepID=A0A1H4HFW4_9SPHI|nr:hypothetical protein [Pedobacter hartonius]SEB20743.1 hypothetical protein SAMN05443550_11739 [Pedobacter hartonius]